jgi:hypothetical protein
MGLPTAYADAIRAAKKLHSADGGRRPPSLRTTPLLAACHSHRCPDDFINSSITGMFPDGSDPCLSTHICVKDVLPGCDCYRGDCDSAWGVWCEDAIAAFDAAVVNGSNVSAHPAPTNIGGDPDAGNPIYYFAAPKPKAYVMYLPPAHGEFDKFVATCCSTVITSVSTAIR